jgi:hypothetical protein
VVTYPIGDGSGDGGFSQRGHTRELATCFGRLGHDCYLEKYVGAVWDMHASICVYYWKFLSAWKLSKLTQMCSLFQDYQTHFLDEGEYLVFCSIFMWQPGKTLCINWQPFLGLYRQHQSHINITSIKPTGLTGFAGLWGVGSCRGTRPCCVFAKLKGGTNMNSNEWFWQGQNVILYAIR